MTVHDALDHLRRAGVSLKAHGRQLVAKGPVELTQSQRALVREWKAPLLRILSGMALPGELLPGMRILHRGQWAAVQDVQLPVPAKRLPWRARVETAGGKVATVELEDVPLAWRPDAATEAVQAHNQLDAMHPTHLPESAWRRRWK